MEQVRFESLLDGEPMPGIPVEYHLVRETRPGIFAAAHWQNTAEFLYVKKGGYRVIAGGISRMLSEGEAVFIRPRQIHTTICPELSGIELVVLKFDPALFCSGEKLAGETEFLSLILRDGPAFWMTAEQGQAGEIGRRLEEICTEWQRQKPGWRVAVRSLIWMILLHLCRFCGEDSAGMAPGESGQDKQFYPVFQYLEEHFTEEIRTAELLSLCHLSYSRFSVRFKQLTGLCLTEYIGRARIQLARELLSSGELPVSAAAERCGYLDVCYFDRVFRRYTGCSPSEFRKKGEM